MSQSSEPGPLNGQQMQMVSVELRKAVDRIMADVELRKLALRNACDLSANKGGTEVVKLAEQMHAFLTQGASDSAK